jgi:hypothetical protein
MINYFLKNIIKNKIDEKIMKEIKEIQINLSQVLFLYYQPNYDKEYDEELKWKSNSIVKPLFNSKEEEEFQKNYLKGIFINNLKGKLKINKGIKNNSTEKNNFFSLKKDQKFIYYLACQCGNLIEDSKCYTKYKDVEIALKNRKVSFKKCSNCNLSDYYCDWEIIEKIENDNSKRFCAFTDCGLKITEFPHHDILNAYLDKKKYLNYCNDQNKKCKNVYCSKLHSQHTVNVKEI